jgi:hypothetical protein
MMRSRIITHATCYFGPPAGTLKLKSKSENDENEKNVFFHFFYFLPGSGLFWVNAHCRRLSARAAPGSCFDLVP